MQEENWKHQWLPLCLATRVRRTIMERPVARLMISHQNLRVSRKPVNPPECVWKTLYRIIMRDHIVGKWKFSERLQFGSQIFSCASSK